MSGVFTRRGQSRTASIKTCRAICALGIAFVVGYGAGGGRRRMTPTDPRSVVDARPPLPLSKETTKPAANFGRYEEECPIPEHTAEWRYYRALAEQNARTAARARNATEYAPEPGKARLGDTSPKIPRRLVFTHKYDIFDCGMSAHPMSQPELYNLAENAKATVRAYQQIWEDLEVVILTDEDCRVAINATEPRLVPHFNKMIGMFKSDLCRSAYLLVHGGYYFDIDMLVVHPYEAPPEADFATVKGEDFPAHGFFQSFMASAPGHRVVKKSLRHMLDCLEGRERAKKLLGPNALYKGYISTSSPNARLLAEFKIAGKWNGLPRQSLPGGHGHFCQFSGLKQGACDRVVADERTGAVYFYSRVQGTRQCHQRMREAWECVEGMTKPIWYE